MAQTKEGAAKAVATIKLRYGESYFRTLGAAGGAVTRGGGFASDRELAARAGSRGGKASRRTTR